MLCNYIFFHITFYMSTEISDSLKDIFKGHHPFIFYDATIQKSACMKWNHCKEAKKIIF